MTALVELLIDESTFLLCFSESRTGSENSTLVPNVRINVIYVYILLCQSKVLLRIVAMVEEDVNCS